MAPKLSIILPYLSNSSCVARCKEELRRNSVNAFEVCEVLDCRAIYRAYNEGVAQAKGEIVVLLNDDMFVAPDWDRLLVEAALGRTVVTTYLVESGKRPVNSGTSSATSAERQPRLTPGVSRASPLDMERVCRRVGSAWAGTCRLLFEGRTSSRSRPSRKTIPTTSCSSASSPAEDTSSCRCVASRTTCRG